MHCFRVLSLSAAQLPSIFEASRSWCWLRRHMFGVMLGCTIHQIVERIRAGKPVRDTYHADYVAASMSSEVWSEGGQIFIVVTFIAFHRDDSDPGGASQSEELAYESPILVMCAMLYLNGESWTLAQIDGDPIFVPNVWDKLPSEPGDTLATIESLYLDEMRALIAVVDAMKSGCVFEIARSMATRTIVNIILRDLFDEWIKRTHSFSDLMMFYYLNLDLETQRGMLVHKRDGSMIVATSPAFLLFLILLTMPNQMFLVNHLNQKTRVLARKRDAKDLQVFSSCFSLQAIALQV